jgi:RNA methyltransferase, TrmH family
MSMIRPMKMPSPREITSSKNPLFQQWRDLLQSRGIKKHGQLLVSGRKIVPELAADPAAKVIALLASAKMEPLTVGRRVNQFDLAPALFRKLDVFGTDFPLAVLEAPRLERADLATAPQGLEILCGLGDPLNVGSLLRAALAFGASRVIFLKESSSPFHPKAIRASAGAALKMPLSAGPSIQELKQNPEWLKHLVILDQGGRDIRQYEWPKSVRLLLGEEGPGLPSELRPKENCLSIPIHPGVESLNAVSAASIALYLYRFTEGTSKA